MYVHTGRYLFFSWLDLHIDTMLISTDSPHHATHPTPVDPVPPPPFSCAALSCVRSSGSGSTGFLWPNASSCTSNLCPVGSDSLSPRNSNAFCDCFVFPCALMILLYVITFGCKPFCRISFRSSTAFFHYLAFPHALMVSLYVIVFGSRPFRRISCRASNVFSKHLDS